MTEFGCMPSDIHAPGGRDIDFRAPGIIHLGEPVVSRGAAVSALSRACQPPAADNGHVKLFLHGALVPDHAHPLLPQAGEEEIAYLQRVAGNPDFAIYCGSVQVYSMVMFSGLRRLLARLFGPAWTPGAWLDAELFLGRYNLTPGGIHRESRYNLHCILAGQKTMLVWPGMRGQKPTGPGGELDRMADFPDALTFPAGAGDVVHWPPGRWHAGYSPALSVGINIAVYPFEPFEPVLRVLGSELHARWPRQEEGAIPAAFAGHLMDAARQVAILRESAESAGLSRAVLLEWLRFRSSSGFRQVPPRREAGQLAPEQALCKADGARLLWTSQHDRCVYYFGNGHVGEPVPGRLEGLFSAVDSGGPFTVATLAEAFSGGHRLAVGRVVAELYEMGVIDYACPVHGQSPASSR